jgi:hypothetical protein
MLPQATFVQATFTNICFFSDWKYLVIQHNGAENLFSTEDELLIV